MGHPRSLDSYGDILSLDDMAVFLHSSRTRINEKLRLARKFGDYTHIPPPRLGRATGKTEWCKDVVRAWNRIPENVTAVQPLSEHAKKRVAR